MAGASFADLLDYAAPMPKVAETKVDDTNAVRASLRARATPERAAVSQRFFKTGRGQYGEGDVFLGVSVPDARAVVKHHRNASLDTARQLLGSKVHEERLTALLLLVDRFERSNDTAVKQGVFNLYMASIAQVNNWDLVDSSAPYIVGPWLVDRDRRALTKLARSPDLWSRRVAMLATYHFIKAGDFSDALRLARLLLADEHDLMHKAVGWMLREIGARGGEDQLRAFLEEHASLMPRTMLRYAIEKLSDAERKKWLAVRRSTRPE